MDNNYENKTILFDVYEVHNLEFPLVSESFFKLIYVESGVLQLSTATDSFELFKGDCRMIFPGEVSSAYTYDYNVCKILTFQTSVCEDFHSAIFGHTQENGIYKLGDDIDYLESIDKDGDYYLNKSNLYGILSSFMQKVVLTKNINKDSQFVSFVTNYVRKHCKEEITLQDLASTLGYGYNYTSALFKKSFKCNFLFFVNQHRIALAEEMLLSRRDMTVTAVAFECGFNSLRSFGRNFKEQKSMSPKEFRLQGR